MTFIIEYFKLNEQNSKSSNIKESKTWADQTTRERCQRVFRVALPFLFLHKTLRFPVSLGLKTVNTVSNTYSLIVCLQDGSDRQNATYQTVQTMIAVTALAGTIFSHPIGMLVTTGQDLMKNTSQVKQRADKKEYKEALESFAKVLTNTLSLALFVHGGLPLSMALLKVRILLRIYNFHKELNDEKYLEATGYLGMTAIRGQQMYDKLLQFGLQQKAPILA